MIQRAHRALSSRFRQFINERRRGGKKHTTGIEDQGLVNASFKNIGSDYCNSNLSHLFSCSKVQKMISVEVIKRYNYPRIFTLLSTATQPIHLIARFPKNSKTNLCCRNLELWFECQLAIGTPDQDSSLQITAAPALYTGATRSLALSLSLANTGVCVQAVNTVLNRQMLTISCLHSVNHVHKISKCPQIHTTSNKKKI